MLHRTENPRVIKQKPVTIASAVCRCPSCGREEGVVWFYEPDTGAYVTNPYDCECGHAWRDEDAE